MGSQESDLATKPPPPPFPRNIVMLSMQGQILTEIQMVAAFVLVWLLFGLGWHTSLGPNSSH